MTPKLRDCLNAISCLRHEDHVRLGSENHDQPLAKDRMVFDTENANLLGLGHGGSRVWRRVYPLFAALASISIRHFLSVHVFSHFLISSSLVRLRITGRDQGFSPDFSDFS